MTCGHGGPRKGAGRPKSIDPLRKRTIALRESEWAELENQAKSNKLPLAEMLRQLIGSNSQPMSYRALASRLAGMLGIFNKKRLTKGTNYDTATTPTA